MKFHIDFWWRIGFGFEVWREQIELASFAYLFLRLWFRGHELVIDLYRTRKGLFGFHINLPFLSLNNDVVQKSVSTGTDPMYRIVPVVTGKVLGRKIGDKRWN